MVIDLFKETNMRQNRNETENMSFLSFSPWEKKIHKLFYITDLLGTHAFKSHFFFFFFLCESHFSVRLDASAGSHRIDSESTILPLMNS